MIDCNKIHEILNRGLRFKFDSTFSNILKQIPKNGIYFIFEKGESAHSVDRIVYIGINKTGTLPNRLNKHFKGSVNNSRLRKHIGDCLLKKDNNIELEKAISNYIQTNMSFVLVEANDLDLRRDMEKALISIVSSCDCNLSQNWLGKLSPSPKIQVGKLWNVEDLHSKTTIDNLEQLLYDGLVLKCDTSKEFKEFLKD